MYNFYIITYHTFCFTKYFVTCDFEKNRDKISYAVRYIEKYLSKMKIINGDNKNFSIIL